MIHTNVIYNLLINVLDANKRINLGKIYLLDVYTNKTNIVNANITSFTK